MDYSYQQYLPLILGGLLGGVVGLVVVLARGLSGAGRTPDGTRLYSGSLLLEGLAGLRANARRIGALFLAVCFLYTLTTAINVWLGVPMGIADLLTGTAIVYLGHRFLLEKPLQETGHSLPDKGFVGVLVRSFLFGLILLAMLAILAIPLLVLTALTRNAGTATGLFDIIFGAGAGLGLVGISLVMSRLTFAFPAAALGRRTWFATAARESQGMTWGLAGALWTNALVGLVVTFVLVAALTVLQALLGLPSSEAARVVSADDPAFVWNLVFVEVPVILATSAYTLIAVSIVSAAYRRTVIDPYRTGTQTTESVPGTGQ